MGCPLENTEYQQFCCLYDKHQENNTFEQCEYQQACSQLNAGVEMEWKKSTARVLEYADYLMESVVGAVEPRKK